MLLGSIGEVIGVPITVAIGGALCALAIGLLALKVPEVRSLV
jgi:hypothetical protein